MWIFINKKAIVCYTTSAMSFFEKHESYLGIDIGAHGMKLVELRQSKGRPQLWTYGIADTSLPIHTTARVPQVTPPGMSAPDADPASAAASVPVVDHTALDEEAISRYVALLKELLVKTKAVSRRATVSLPVSSIFHAVVTLPKVPAKELEHHVMAKVKNMLPDPLDTMQIVHQVIPPRAGALGNDMKILVTAAPREMVKFYTTIFSRAGLTLEALETEAFAVERSLMGHDQATAMIVDIGYRRTNFFIIDRGVPITHRSLELGGRDIDTLLTRMLEVPDADIAQIKTDAGDDGGAIPSDMFAPLIDPMRKEIQYNVDLYVRQTGNENVRPEKIILTGGSALFPPVVKLIAEAFPLKVFIGDPWARVVYQQGLQLLLNPIAPRMTVAIGLALRHFSP